MKEGRTKEERYDSKTKTEEKGERGQEAREKTKTAQKSYTKINPSELTSRKSKIT